MIIGSGMLFHENLSSTNSEASMLLKAGEPVEGTVVYTGFQTAGQGQAGNKWESEKDKNLLISIILYPKSVNPEDQFLISMALSLGICEFLDRHIPATKIKWPNDIYLGNDKIAGILIENSIMGDRIENSVAGIGLNVNQDNFTGVRPAPVSLKMATGREYDLGKCLEELLRDLDMRYKHLLYGDRQLLKSDYLSRLYRFREWHSYKSSDSLFEGMISDVLISGQVKIDVKGGITREFSFKEFEYLP